MNKVIEIVSFRALPCEASTFTIGGVDADKSDFGDQLDRDQYSETREEYCCSSNQFIPHESIPKGVLRKYNIDKAEYRKIQDKLSAKFYIGSCGWCS
jgi:hypothetical protein